MSFTAKDVKELREKTGAGMMNCKSALTECDGDLEKAVDYLRAKGLAAAAKKQSRIAAEGAVTSYVNGNLGVLVEVNCETDFVANGNDFKAFVDKVAKFIATSKASSVEELKSLKDGSLTIEESINELVLKVGEKIDIRRFQTFSVEGNGQIGTYVHGNKIGVLTMVKTDKDISGNEEFNEFVKDVCMHVAASDPKFISGDEIDEDFKNKEAEVYAAQLREQGKSEEMIPNIVKGKLNKLATEVCLLEQKFVKNPDITVKALVKEIADKSGAKLTVEKFLKFNLGEGIEKKEDNLADEVAKLTGKA